SLVRVRDVITQEVDGRLVQTIVLAPTDGVLPEGINLWMFAWNPAKPGEVVFANAFMGSSPVCLATAFINTEMEQDLLRTMWRTVGHAQKAQKAGIPLEDWLAKEDPAILRRRRVYQGFEFFPQRADEMRKYAVVSNLVVNPDVPVKCFVDTFESSGDRFGRLLVDGEFINNLPNANEPPGFSVNGEPITADNFLFLRKWDGISGSSLDRLSSAELALVEDRLKSHCGRKVVEETVGRVLKMLDPLYDSQVDVSQVDSYEHKYNSVESTTTLNLVAKDILCNLLLKDYLDNVARELNSHFPRYGPLDMRIVVTRVATHAIFLPLMRPRGLLAQCGYQRIRNLCMPVFTKIANNQPLDPQLKDLEETKSYTLERIEGIRNKIQKDEKTDPVQSEHQKNLKAAEKTLEMITRKQSGLETVERELDDPDSVFEEQRRSESEVKEQVIEELTTYDLARLKDWETEAAKVAS
ncbi:MAG: hypothetical protein Q9191_008052, partial [Dirinaria sp. TL-2023a]